MNTKLHLSKNVIKFKCSQKWSFLFSFLFLISASLHAQCGTFTPPATPTGCDYTYTGTGSTGWQNGSGSDIAAPPNLASAIVVDGLTVCILSDLNYDFAGLKNGTFYVAPGVTYSGAVTTIKTMDIIIEGTATFTDDPSTGNYNFYVYDTGTLNFTFGLAVSTNDVMYNNGDLNVGGDLDVSGEYNSYPDSNTVITGDVSIQKDYNNCGLLEIFGDLHTSGSSTFNNACATYVHGDFHMTGDYTNIGLMYFAGGVNFVGPSTLYNNGILVFDDLVLNSDDIVGTPGQSAIIIRSTATLTGGASVTGHYFYNAAAPLGTGFDSVCGTCTADIEILIDAYIPSLTEEILADCGANIRIGGPYEATIDFDGIDDYLDSTANLSTYSKASAMAWVKIDPAFSSTGTVVSQGDFEIKVNANRQIVVNVNTQNIVLPASTALNFNEWANIAVTFDASLPGSNIKVYKNGDLIFSSLHIALISSSTDLFTIGKDSASNTDYFKGDIDEVRVFDIALSDDQLRKIVYQEIVENFGSVSGIVIPKTVLDFSTNATISWSNLKAYYPMTDIKTFRTTDFSSYNNDATLHNIETILEQTAPMPFTTSADGDLTAPTTFVHGDVWDISNLTELEWAILQVKHNVSINADLKTAGLLVDANKTITVTGDHMIQDKWYLELNGVLDLQNDSQLVQSKNSDLVTSVNGKILRRQEGNSSVYWYNYWSSPVGSQAATSYLDNNSAANNPNNTAFTHNMLKDGTGSAIQYTNAANAVGKVSTVWLYGYLNGVTYYDWNHLAVGEAIIPGAGYLQKGTGVGAEQQYLHEGKPNNGTILINAVDTGGPGSVEGTTQTSSLVGNPYPSAIDARQFILDNTSGATPVIDGTIFLWQQWAGTSHNTIEYEGGYAYINGLTTVKAAQYPYAGAGATPALTKRPSFYIPVSQGFFVEVMNSGAIEFNNGQRVFIKESDADENNPNVGSTFFKTNNPPSPTGDTFETGVPNYQLLRLELSMSDTSSRTMVLGFDHSFTDEGREYGFDGGFISTPLSNDLGSLLNGEQYVIQALAPITEDKVVDLTFTATGTETYTIKNIEIANIPDTQAIYLRDNVLGTYFDLRNELGYNFTSEAGTFTDRFDVVFNNGNLLSTETLEALNGASIYYTQSQETIFVKGLKEDVKQLTLYNALGQVILTKRNVSPSVLESGIKVSNLSTGLYVVSLKMENNQTLDKKIIIN